MSNDDVQTLIPLMPEIAFNIQITRFMIVSAYTLQVYEWLICFRDEYLYVHKARWTSVKIAYLFCRYNPLFVFPFHLWTFVGNHALSVCTKIFRPSFMLLGFFPMSAQAVFIIRTYAYTGRNKFILAFLVACWLMLSATLFWVLKQFTLFHGWHTYVGDTGCFGVTSAAGQFSWANSSLIGIAVYHLCTFSLDSLMTAIVLIQCLRYRSMRGPLGKVFVSQGLLAYVTLSAMNLAIAMAFFGPDRRWDHIANFNLIFNDVIACRLILMLRRRGDPHRKYSEQVRDRFRSIQVSDAEDVFIDDGSSDRNQRIENWG